MWVIKILLSGMSLLFTLLLIGIISSNLWIELQTQDRLYSDISKVPNKKIALLLGTVKYLRRGNINSYFKYRIDAAVQLYKAGKVKHILASGSNHTSYYNEPVDMQKALMARGVPAHAITLDYAGFRTLDSVIRCKKIFSQETDIIIVSQKFHNKRALFIGDFYNIKSIGFNAKDVPFKKDFKTTIREYLARFKAVLDLYFLKTQPKFLGKKVQINFS
ncbi:ElyC/SanA/YdcF family protein [Thiotrichales bacterium HSG1]|nr:ElyC/SanA/YdcF family protein [Thiotrichales bacterium HSG1]